MKLAGESWKRFCGLSFAPALRWALAGVLVLLFAASAEAARISDMQDTNVWEQAIRFFSLRDDVVRTALLGSIFLGISCGLLGSFIVVRKLSLFGDTLSHAVLPGVAIGYLVAGEKDPFAIFVGATVAGVLGTVVVNLIKKTTHIKEDSSLGMVLAGFYGIGIVLMNRIQKLPTGTQSGVNKFLFGQAAAVSPTEVWMIAGVAVAAVLMVLLFYRQFLLGSFDIGFARSLGLPAGLFHYLLMMLLAFTVVVSLQAVGAVLVSAMLVIPAASAYLLTDRMHRMLVLASVFGIFSGVLGAFFSFLGNSLPTGPLMVLAASSIFTLSFLFSPKHGLVSRWRKRRRGQKRIENENTLKAIYQVRESYGFAGEGVRVKDLALRMGETTDETRRRLEKLAAVGVCDLKEIEGKSYAFLNPDGWLRACAVVRNHRLWELYLTNQAEYEPDHVHDDAEVIEHILGEETVRHLERLLDYPAEDPHGKLIPSLADLQRSLTKGSSEDKATGYRMPNQ
ncbi:metal ABC transporter permease [Pelagicoccus sp. SDUM812005]|uniref:metal ABC transporter permease n=1 Tax=Pelagicoccus sp. SDUM812005 TaxID=3041257 RepID=UPI00280DE2B0|nr:metal ABC transporter permease [Pelagicoccus sp. SDUM812005]MDQ8180888.1 metal ABC transporter permease [Pelagicoccus sp. SDUM812005]